MMTSSRRTFTQDLLGSLLSFSLVKTLYDADSLAQTIKPLAHQWLRRLEALCRDLKQTNLGQAQWQKQIEDLFSRVELKDILRTINFDRLVKKVKLSDEREAISEIGLPPLEGVPPGLTFSLLFEALKKDRAIAPHGHRNMATMNLILNGQVRLCQYDRMGEEAQHLLIAPTVDRLCGLGELSSISDEKNNLHWFRGNSEVTYIFNAAVYGLNPSEGFIGREYVDPDRGEKIKEGLIRVRRLNQDEAFRLYNRAKS